LPLRTKRGQAPENLSTLKSWPLVLGVLSTALVLLFEFLTNPPRTNPALPTPFNQPILLEGTAWYFLMRLFIVLIPITITLFLAADRLFKSGNKWLFLRYYAEEIKSDIFSFRVLSISSVN
jgi:hypothetical protein